MDLGNFTLKFNSLNGVKLNFCFPPHLKIQSSYIVGAQPLVIDTILAFIFSIVSFVDQSIKNIFTITENVLFSFGID